MFLLEEPESRVTLPGTLLGREIVVKGLRFNVTQILAKNKSCDFVFLPLSFLRKKKFSEVFYVKLLFCFWNKK